MKNIGKNLILLSDSYKCSHHSLFPSGTSQIYSYFESRGSTLSKDTVFFGLQYLLKHYLEGRVIDGILIQEAEYIAKLHGVPFNKEGWQHILLNHGGTLPVKIRAVPEGMIVPTSNVLMTVENTDPKCYWLTNYLETLLSQIWYPCTVATLSRQIKKTILKYLEETGDPSGIDFKLHDFGFRGVSSVESAAIGGSAHLINFKGTDTLVSLQMIRKYYNEKDPQAYSIPASEHSTITSWGRENELAAYENMLNQYPEGLVACVSDSYNIYQACEQLWGTLLKEKILNRKGTLVIRPDSGDPVTTVCDVLEILTRKFGHTVNSKGYKVLPPQVRVIQGDGVNKDSIEEILKTMKIQGYSADNVAFGMGGKLLQFLHRDNFNFAFKCSSAVVNGQQRDVYKEPIGSTTKQSKRGRLALVNSMQGLATVCGKEDNSEDILETVFENGKLLRDDSFSTIRQRASL